jgi:membrane protease YdiL (CAAX protease family)
MLAKITDIQIQLLEKETIFWWALAVSLLVLGIAWHKGLFKTFQASSFPIIRGKDVLKGFGFFLFIELLLIPALASLGFILAGKDSQTLHLTPQLRGWLNLLIIVGGFGGVLLAYLQLTIAQRHQLWQQTSTPWYVHVEIGIAAWFVSYPLVLAFSQGLSLVLWHVFHHPFVEQVAVQNLRHAMDYPFLFGLTSLVVITLVPFTEELLFRGLLQSWLKHKFHNTTLAILLSSLVFALFHYSSQQGVTNIELLSSLFLLSCMLGYIYERQRSLWAPMGLHGFFNLMSLLMLFQ